MTAARTRRLPAALAAVAAAAGLALAGAAAQQASAVPIRDVSVQVSGSTAEFSFSVFSPPNARVCTANVRAVLARVDYGVRIVRSLGTNKVNVCQTGRRGWTSGAVTGRMSLAGLPSGRYALLIRASQVTRNTRPSTHSALKVFYVY